MLGSEERNCIIKKFYTTSRKPNEGKVNLDCLENNDWKFYQVLNDFHTIRCAHVIDSNKDNCKPL